MSQAVGHHEKSNAERKRRIFSSSEEMIDPIVVKEEVGDCLSGVFACAVFFMNGMIDFSECQVE